MTFDLSRRLAAEMLGTALLLAAIVGSGIMAEHLSQGNAALALLCNALASGAALTVLITLFAPVSGAHFNPVISLAATWCGQLRWRDATAYIPAQMIGAVGGVWAAHLMFAEPLFQVSTKLRSGAGQSLSEFIATFGLVVTVFAMGRLRPQAVPVSVGLYIVAAYWFTASTSFANPAVTLARSLTGSFAGIAPAGVPAFLAAQFAGAGAASLFVGWLLKDTGATAPVS